VLERKLDAVRLRYLEALGEKVEVPAAQDETFYQGQYLIDFAKDLVAEVGDVWKNEDWPSFKEYVEKRMFNVIKTTLARVNGHTTATATASLLDPQHLTRAQLLLGTRTFARSSHPA
jgi:extradiol dioxygenase family protein